MKQKWEVDLPSAMNMAIQQIEERSFCSTKVISVHRQLARLDGFDFHAYAFEFEVDYTPEVVENVFGGMEVFGMGPFGFGVITDGNLVFQAGHINGAIADFNRENLVNNNGHVDNA